MQTPDLADENFQKLAALFPNAVTETKDEDGNVVRSIDADVLRQEINTSVVEGPDERYQFTWPGKREAIRLAAAPIAASLRPCREESVDFDKTENVYIEGDNLDVLKLLRETYLGKVKMIYIDPPYNTGNDFIYEDDFAGDTDEFLLRDNQYDDQGNRLVQNTDSNGRFHTDWLNMIYPRLRIAKDLLSENGVIFISIDHNEIENLKKMCNEVFGCDNSEIYIWDTREAGTMPKTAKGSVRIDNEYIVAAFKADKKLSKYSEKKYLEKASSWNNPDNDPRGPWMSANISRGSGEATGGSKSFTITNPAGISFTRDWSVSEAEYYSLLKDNRIFFADEGRGVPRKKVFATDTIESIQSSLFENLRSATSAGQQLAKILGGKFFSYPKPCELLMRLLQIGGEQDAIILDFFSGSATTAHAVMQQNAEDGGKRKFIMVQLPEICDADSEAFKAGYKNICEIGKERIRRAGKKIKEENPLAAANLDTGFRVFKLDSSNMKDVYYNPGKTEQKDLLGHVDNIKEDRTPEDLLFQVMLEFGIPLSSKIRKTAIAGKDVFNVEDNFLIACFDDAITNEIITAIAKEKPQYVVLRDSGFKTDSVAANFEQIFATYSPDTTRRIL